MLSSSTGFARILDADSTMQSNLPNYAMMRLGLGAQYRRAQLLCLAIYGALVALATWAAFAPSASAGIRAAILGTVIPGGGLLQWLGEGQMLVILLLFCTSLLVFIGTLVLWLATGNVLAPIAVWVGLAWLSTEPELLGLDRTSAHAFWPLGLGPFAFAAMAATWLRAALAPQPPIRLSAVADVRDAEPARPAELSLEDLKRIRLLMDRALQAEERFDGFERRDQFQTGALRYQINFVSYALAAAWRLHAPAAVGPYGAAQDRLMAKIGDRRVWNYWRLENAWGNFRLDADPVARQNIMYSGFTALQMGLGGRESLVLQNRGHEWRQYGLGEVASLLADQYRVSRHGLLACEPNWIYPLCNLITMAGIKAADARLGTERWNSLADNFLASLQREGTSKGGSFIAFRSALTGLAPPAPGGIVMQAFPCLFLNSLSTELAHAHWQRVRHQLDTQSWKRLFWPVDVGNYGFSRASSYAATAAAAVEMGDEHIASECLRLLEEECPSRDRDGAIHRDRASLWAHAVEVFARCGKRDGLREMVSGTPETGGPHLLRISCPKLHVASARADSTGLSLSLYPGGGQPVPVLELGGLLPDRFYHTGNPRSPLLKADRQGRAVVHLPLDDRRDFSIRLVQHEERQWSAA